MLYSDADLERYQFYDDACDLVVEIGDVKQIRDNYESLADDLRKAAATTIKVFGITVIGLNYTHKYIIVESSAVLAAQKLPMHYKDANRIEIEEVSIDAPYMVSIV